MSQYAYSYTVYVPRWLANCVHHTNLQYTCKLQVLENGLMELKTYNNNICSITTIAYVAMKVVTSLARWQPGPTSYSCMVPSLADSTYGLLGLSTSHLHAQHRFHPVAVTLGHYN